MNTLMETWMVIVGLSMAVGVIPQGYRLWKRKSSEDMAILPTIILIHGLVWWLIYGIQLRSISLIVTNCVGLVLDTIILVLILKYRKRRPIIFGSAF
jgi:MtN3 and saliva related transmembrane protein